ncbi:MAG: hypothetical protein OXC19_17725 [Bryobacterales bacterium]|nr:hypothetical protein [Bryobacterales bacterium]
MRDQTTRRPGRFGKAPKRRPTPRGRFHGGSDGGRYDGGGNGNRHRNVNGNRIRNGHQGEAALCIKCGHPAPDGKLCGFHRSLLNIFRKEIPEQDPRRFRF